MYGIYLINKPTGITSHDVVDYLRRITHEKTIGHAGTLDPLASGLMIVAIGREFTKRISEFSKLDKEYIAEATLGAISTTYDAEGVITLTRHSGLDPESRQKNKQKKILNPIRHSGEPAGRLQNRINQFIRSWTHPSLSELRRADASQDDEVVTPSLEEISKIIQSFVGKQEQMPPAFSAKKIKGQKAYDLARQGKTTQLKPVPVNIYEIELINYQYPRLKFRTKVSSGTYIRSLVHDLGQKLGTGAYMSNLVRSQIGNYELTRAIDLYSIKTAGDLSPARVK